MNSVSTKKLLTDHHPKMRLSTKHMQFGLVAIGVFALVAIDLYAGNKDRDVDVPVAGEQQQNDNVSSNLERRAAEGELEMYNNNMLDASLAVYGEELPATAYMYNPLLPGQDDQPKPRSIARRDEDLDFAVNDVDAPILEVQDQQIQPGAMDRYEVKPDAPKPAYMLPPPKKRPPPKPVQPVQPVPPPIMSEQQSLQPQPPRPAQPKPKPQPRPIKPNFLEQAAKANEAASTKIEYNPGATAGRLRGNVDAGRNQAQNAAYHPHLDQNQGKISEMEVVEGEVQRRKARATWLTGGLFGGLFVVYKAASMGYLLF